jgi:hypothetical protein
LNINFDYTIENEEKELEIPKIFKKKIIFNVISPFLIKGVKLKILNENIFVKFELTNLTNLNFFFDNLNFLLDSKQFDIKDRSIRIDEDKFDKIFFPKETKNFLYELVKKEIILNKENNLVDKINLNDNNLKNENKNQNETSLGRISLTWTRKMGEKGSLNTSPINIANFPKHDFDLKFLEIRTKDPVFNNIKIAEEFEIKFSLENKTDKIAEIIVFLNTEEMFPICLSGNSINKVGKIDAFSKIEIFISFISLATGIQTIGSGISIKNTISNKKYNLSEFYFFNFFNFLNF